MRDDSGRLVCGVRAIWRRRPGGSRPLAATGIILLSGVSGAGKTTLAAQLQRLLSHPDRPFLHIEADRLLPHLTPDWPSRNPAQIARLSRAMRDACLAFAANGFDLIVDGVLPYGDPAQVVETLEAFRMFRLCYVGVHCDLQALDEREKRRPDRDRGWARHQYRDLHANQRYDIEVDTTSKPAEESARAIARYIARLDPGVRINGEA